MTAPITNPDFSTLIDFQFPGSDLVAVIPYALPLIFIGTIMLLYQRYMERDSKKRNFVLLGGFLSLLIAVVLVVYAGFGSYWWWSPEVTMGSWDVFVAMLQWLTDFIFGSVLVGAGYLVGISLLFAIMAKLVIAPPNPDFVKINEELKEAKEVVERARSEVQKLEGENKQLNEFITEKETRLSTLQDEVFELKSRIQSREAEFAELQVKIAEPAVAAEPSVPTEAAADLEAEHLVLVAKKDKTIGALQDEIALLKEAVASGAPPTAAETPLANEAAIQLEELRRRTETAGQVIDAIITDLVELISLVEGSSLESSAKDALRGLIEGLGRRISQVAGAPDERATGEPRVELIGAVTMIQEIVDGIKRLARGS